MKTKILFSIFAVSALLFSAACNDDDDYSPATGQLISSVSTGATDVTANSATLHATVNGDISKLAPSAYTAGFNYGFSQDNLSEKIAGSVSGNDLTATITGLTKGQNVYYQAFVTLQGKVTYTGEIKSLTTTDATVATGDAANITYYSAELSGTINGGEGTDAGFIISTSEETVRAGLAVKGAVESGSVKLKKLGLLPSKTYYYQTFMNLGVDTLFGETKSFTTEAFEVQKEDAVDLGLSVKWLKYNVGASKESDFGGLYGYGDVTGCKNSTSVADYVNADIVESNEDVARINLGLKAKMPTADQLEELFTLCEKEWIEDDGVQGLKLTGPNGNSIFLPAAGYREGNTVNQEGEVGMYCSGNINNDNYAKAYIFKGNNAAMTVFPTFRAMSIRPVYSGGGDIAIDNTKIKFGNIEEANNNLRIEIYNAYGSTNEDSPLDIEKIKFDKNIIVKFKVEGITDNLIEDAPESYTAGLEFADGSWGTNYWAQSENSIYDCVISGDGEYIVWFEGSGSGANVFCIDIMNIVDKLVDVTKFKAEIKSIAFDNPNIYYQVGETPFQNKDGNETDGRAEIYNEYGAKANPADDLNFNGQMIIDFTITGIDGNLKDNASAKYITELSYAAASWSPAYWGKGLPKPAEVTKDGDYQVYAYLNGDCVGAVVWTIELYDLWKDLVDTEKIKITVNKITIPGKVE